MIFTGYCKGYIYDYRCYFIPEASNIIKSEFMQSDVVCEKLNASLMAIFNKQQMKWLSAMFP